MPDDIVTDLRVAARIAPGHANLMHAAADHIERWQEVAWRLADTLLETAGGDMDDDLDTDWIEARRKALSEYWIMCGKTEGRSK